MAQYYKTKEELPKVYKALLNYMEEGKVYRVRDLHTVVDQIYPGIYMQRTGGYIKCLIKWGWMEKYGKGVFGLPGIKDPKVKTLWEEREELRSKGLAPPIGQDRVFTSPSEVRGVANAIMWFLKDGRPKTTKEINEHLKSRGIINGTVFMAYMARTKIIERLDRGVYRLHPDFPIVA